MDRTNSALLVTLLLLTFSMSMFTVQGKSSISAYVGNEIDSPNPWYYMPGWLDYASSGIPDFDQRQAGTYVWQDAGGVWSHCGPVAVANSLWWLDSQFEPNPIPPPIFNDGFPLVATYGLWDDHNSLNVPSLVEHLAFLMDTDGRRTGLNHFGTTRLDMQAGLTQYLSWTGVNPKGDVNGDGIVDQTDLDIATAALGKVPGDAGWNMAADLNPASISYPPAADNTVDMTDLNLIAQNFGETGLFYEHTENSPTFEFIRGKVEKCDSVVLLLGFWVFDQAAGWSREGGHYVTVAGIDSTSMKLAISDPIEDAFEMGLILEGRVPSPHIHAPPEPPYITHNDAALVSQDAYVTISLDPLLPPNPGGNVLFEDYMGNVPPLYTVIEAAVVTSSYVKHDIEVAGLMTSKSGCDPQPTVGVSFTTHVDVSIENTGDFAEAFMIRTYANDNLIDQAWILLPEHSSSIRSFVWNTVGFVCGSYTLSAVADTVNGETDSGDNLRAAGSIVITIPGDIDGNLHVQLQDLVRMANAWGSIPGNPSWSPNADVDDSGRVGLADLVILALHFGQ